MHFLKDFKEVKETKIEVCYSNVEGVLILMAENKEGVSQAIGEFKDGSLYLKDLNNEKSRELGIEQCYHTGSIKVIYGSRDMS